MKCVNQIWSLVCFSFLSSSLFLFSFLFLYWWFDQLLLFNLFLLFLFCSFSKRKHSFCHFDKLYYRYFYLKVVQIAGQSNVRLRTSSFSFFKKNKLKENQLGLQVNFHRLCSFTRFFIKKDISTKTSLLSFIHCELVLFWLKSSF